MAVQLRRQYRLVVLLAVRQRQRRRRMRMRRQLQRLLLRLLLLWRLLLWRLLMRQRWWSLVRAEGARLVLGLGSPQSRLLSHHALPIGRQMALGAIAKAIFAVALVPLQDDLVAVVATTRTIRRRSGRPGSTAGAGRTAAQVGLLIGRLRVGQHVVPAVVRHHGCCVGVCVCARGGGMGGGCVGAACLGD